MRCVISIHDLAIFPDTLEYGYSGGPTFKTTVNADFAGNEQRNQDWSQTRHRFDVGNALKAKASYDTLKTFFMARRGRLFGFRFKDFLDFTALDQALVRLDGFGIPIKDVNGNLVSTGDGAATVFQMHRAYDSASKKHFREITRPRDPALIAAGQEKQPFRVRVNGVVQTEVTHYSVNRSTGRVTFVSPPGNGLAVDWSGEFDVPVRFAEDSFPAEIERFDWHNAQFELIEIRNEEDA